MTRAPTKSRHCFVVVLIVALGLLSTRSNMRILTNSRIDDASLNKTATKTASPVGSEMVVAESDRMAAHVKASSFSQQREEEQQKQVNDTRTQERNQSIPQQHQSQSQSRFAYLFLLGAVDPTDNGYRGYLLNTWIAAYLLRLGGSKADIILMLQFANGTPKEELTSLEQHITADLGIQIRMLSTPSVKMTFASVVMEKLRLFQLTEYERVIFFDGDAFPYCSMDYLFEESVKPAPLTTKRIIMDNFIQNGRNSPMNAGMFMVKPEEGDWEQLQAIIRDRDLVNGTTFDTQYGWGHRIGNNEGWDSHRQSNQAHWDFYGARLDQGLLYYYLRYVKGSLTQSSRRRFRVWDAPRRTQTRSRDGKLVTTMMIQQTMYVFANPLRNVSCAHHAELEFANNEPTTPCNDFGHLFGGYKPWARARDSPRDLSYVPERLYGSKSPLNLWFVTLRQLIRTYNITYLDVDDWARTKKESLSSTKINPRDAKEDFVTMVQQRSNTT